MWPRSDRDAEAKAMQGGGRAQAVWHGNVEGRVVVVVVLVLGERSSAYHVCFVKYVVVYLVTITVATCVWDVTHIHTHTHTHTRTRTHRHTQNTLKHTP